MELLTSDEIITRILELVKNAESNVKIASAWIKGRYFEEVIDTIKKIKEKKKELSLEIILRASELRDMQITDAKVFRKIKEAGGNIYLCERLHAKFILVDDCKLILGSANFTDSGLSDIKSGNIEAGAYYQGREDEENVKKMIDYFEEIKDKHSLMLGDALVGFVLNSVKPRQFDFLLLDEELPVLSYVEVIQEKKTKTRYIGRVSNINAYDLGFFSNPFIEGDNGVAASSQDFRKILSQDSEINWRKAALFAYRSDNTAPLRIARAEVVCVVQENSVSMPEYPFDAGLPVYRADRETISRVFSSGRGTMPVVIGKLKGTDVDAIVDLGEVLKRHMMVTGVTGAGKSHFVKAMIRAVLHEHPGVQVIVFDSHGEYAQEFEDILDKVYHKVFEDVLLPLDGDEAKELIIESGFGTLVQGNSNEANYIRSNLEKYIRPSLETSLKEKPLEAILQEVIMGAPQKGSSSKQSGKQKTEDGDGQVDREVIVEQIISHLKRIYGERALTQQPETCREIQSVLDSGKPLVIVDLSSVTNAKARINIAGLLLQEILVKNRQSPEGERRKRLLVIEEAQNFAPEKAYGGGEVSAGKDNLSLTALQKLATEGRKFDIGLVVVTQRPAQVSKYVLSQMNTQVVFRTISKHNLDVLEGYMEHSGKELVELAPSLPTGVGIISGVAVPFSIVFESNGGN
ncbi:MAG: DUF87 domain-containing protein [Candidatus Kryptonium sp.]